MISFYDKGFDGEFSMEPVRVSPKYQIVIPRAVRESLQIRPGQEMQVFAFEGRIEVVPVRPVKSLRGCAKGIDTHIQRDADRV